MPQIIRGTWSAECKVPRKKEKNDASKESEIENFYNLLKKKINSENTFF